MTIVGLWPRGRALDPLDEVEDFSGEAHEPARRRDAPETTTSRRGTIGILAAALLAAVALTLWHVWAPPTLRFATLQGHGQPS